MPKPQLTLRRMLLITGVSAVFFLIVSLGLRGNLVANAAAIALSALFVFFVVHALLYFIVMPFAYLAEQRYRRRQRKTPFADGNLPPEQTGLEEVI